MKRRLQAAAALLAILQLGACSAATTDQFAIFSKAGTTLADSTPPLLDAAFAEAVKTDTVVLTVARDSLPDKNERLKALDDSDKLLQQRVEIFADLKRHSQLLRNYFVTLGNLADTSGDSALGDSAKGIVDELGVIHPKLAEASIGGIAVSSLVQTAVPVAVGVFRSVALESELKARATTIASEIDLEKAVLMVISEAMQHDVKARMEQEDFTNIVKPFVNPGPLPSDWNTKRLASLQRPTAIEAVDAAARAADNLRQSFVALTEGGSGASLALLVADVSRVASLVEQLKPAKS